MICHITFEWIGLGSLGQFWRSETYKTGLSNSFLNSTPKTQERVNWIISKFKNDFFYKKYHRESKKSPQRERIFASHIFDKGLSNIQNRDRTLTTQQPEYKWPN